MKTSYFSFGGNHAHRINGHTLDHDSILKVTSDDPRRDVFEMIGSKWSMEYDELPEMHYFPRGIYNYNENRWE